MPRLHRSLRATRVHARRRHRTWMLSMCLASLAWGCYWLDQVLMRFMPDLVPSFALVSSLASLFALGGTLVALFSFRGNALWLALALVPLLANLSLLIWPWLMPASSHLVG